MHAYIHQNYILVLSLLRASPRRTQADTTTAAKDLRGIYDLQAHHTCSRSEKMQLAHVLHGVCCDPLANMPQQQHSCNACGSGPGTFSGMRMRDHAGKER